MLKFKAAVSSSYSAPSHEFIFFKPWCLVPVNAEDSNVENTKILDGKIAPPVATFQPGDDVYVGGGAWKGEVCTVIAMCAEGVGEEVKVDYQVIT